MKTQQDNLLEQAPVEDRQSEQAQVALAASPAKMRALLLAATAQAGIIPVTGAAAPACRILDMKYEPGEYCRVLYEMGDDLITGSMDWREPAAQPVDVDGLIPALGMQLHVYPHDPHMPTLRQALTPDVLSQRLAQTLPECVSGRARILRCRVQMVRFRPGRRCTARVDLWLHAAPPDGGYYRQVFYAKIYHDVDKARHVFDEMQAVAADPAIQNSALGLAPAPYFLEDLAVVLLEPVSGTPLDLLLDSRLARLPEAGRQGNRMAAAALAALHTAGLSSGRARPIEKELKRFQNRAAKIALIQPALGSQIIAAALALAAWLPALDSWGARQSIVHGDCKPAQFLIAPGGAILLDFDHLGMGDPAGDVGTYCATLRQSVIQQQRRGLAPSAVWMQQVRADFLAAYQSTSGEPPGFEQRAAWYEAAGLVRKAIRGFERSPAAQVPAQYLQAAREILAAL